jgi:hypothetical protein
MNNPETKEYLSQAIYVKTEVITAENIDQYFPAE